MTISLFSNIGSSLLFKSPISRFAAATAIIGLAVFTISKINERLKNASGSGVLGVNPGLIQDKSVELKKKISELESTVARQASEIESLRNTNKTFSSLEEANKNLSKKLDECQKENEVHKLSQFLLDVFHTQIHTQVQT